MKKDVLKYDTIAVDFDGTIVENKYPDIGELFPDAKRIINKYKSLGGHVIINTCRSGLHEEKVVEFLEDNDIMYDAINENLPHRIKLFNADCRKIGADLYLDDRDVWFESIKNLIGWKLTIEHYWNMVEHILFTKIEVEDDE